MYYFLCFLLNLIYKTIKQQNNKTTKQQNNKTTKQQNNKTTKQQNNKTNDKIIHDKNMLCKYLFPFHV